MNKVQAARFRLSKLVVTHPQDKEICYSLMQVELHNSLFNRSG